MNKTITPEIVVAYSQCPRKAFFCMCTDEKGTLHEYMQIIEEVTKKNRECYFEKIKEKNSEAVSYSRSGLKRGTPIMLEAKLKAEYLNAYADVIFRSEETSFVRIHNYVPTLAVGTYKISKEQKLQLAYTGYVLSKLQKEKPTTGTIITGNGKSHKTKLEPLYKEVGQILRKLKEWRETRELESPSVILNKHCSICPFQKKCEAKAKEQDHLSLLDKVTTLKQIKKYERKGIFTVNQLSYLYRPRVQRKRSRNPPALQHSLELQALVIRTGRIYLHKPPTIERNSTELFLDIEGIPDQQYFYLFGLLVCEGDTSKHYSFWANTAENELNIWQQLLEILEQYSNCPIYHYGNYEAKAITTLEKRYDFRKANISKLLVNINTYIYGKIYFPLYSNRLKEIGNFVGASWTIPRASGLQSLVWRYFWENTQRAEYKQRLVQYNMEDCRALKLLTDFLSVVEQKGNSLLDIDSLVHTKKPRTSRARNPLHRQLETLLEFSHVVHYKTNKITFRDSENANIDRPKKKKAKRIRRKRRTRRPTQVILVPHSKTCERCGSLLTETKRKTQRTYVDLIFKKNSVRKSVRKLVARITYCRNCKRSIRTPLRKGKGPPQMYGYGFKIWIVYQRVEHRLSFSRIRKMLQDLFDEDPSDRSIVLYLNEVASNYSLTEENILKKLLSSPFLHVDDTMVNIDHVNQYVWVLTDGKHVVYRYTETRGSSSIQDLLFEYSGILISDFYPGFDALKCKQQKCLVHLIRDLNNSLWQAHLDSEFEEFIGKVQDLIIPIMETIQRYGLKKRHLNKFKKKVDGFYKQTIRTRSYKSEWCCRFQERFVRYQNSLFTFLEHDGILWHNNPAENALRQVTMQSDISRIFHKTAIEGYLLLLGIKHTCQFQDKSFLKYLLSGEKDVDKFESHKKKNSLYIGLPIS